LSVAPLRERRDDIPLLIQSFLANAGSTIRLGPETMRELENRPWRGNVRELRNFVERVRALGAEEALAMIGAHGTSAPRPRSIAATTVPSLVDDESIPPPPPLGSLSGTVARFPTAPPPSGVEGPEVFQRAYREFREAWIEAGEREYVRQLLSRNGRNVATAAKEADVDRTHIYRLMRKHML
jgi:DNA-binding NtrC family response regulator